MTYENTDADFSSALSITYEHAIRLATLGIHRLPEDAASALRESINDGAPLVLSIELSPEPRLICKVGELEVFRLEP